MVVGVQYESKNMSDVLKARESLETRLIAMQGYAVRAFQEDNHVKASWAYTVGLSHNDNPVCLFTRAAVESTLLEQVVEATADFVRDHGPTTNEFHIPEFTLKDSKSKIRFKLRKMTIEVIERLKEKFDNFIEGQKEHTTYYWLLIADSNNILPGEQGYIDFMQFGDLENQDNNMSHDSLIENFDED